jgi:molybdate transport system substrate-binding protein
MNTFKTASCLAALLTANILLPASAPAAEITVMISGGFSAAYRSLVPEFERATQHKVITLAGPSMGTTPQAIPNRLSRGEPADVLILADSALDKLIQNGMAIAGSRTDLAKSNIALAVRSGAPKPDISTVEAFKKALLAAKSIAYSDSASGVYLSTVLFPRLGIADQIKDKSRGIKAEPVAEVVARGEAELGFQQLSELLPVHGVDVVGNIPAEVQKTTIFSAGIASGSKEPGAAKELIKFLASPAAAAAIKRSGMEP